MVAEDMRLLMDPLNEPTKCAYSYSVNVYGETRIYCSDKYVVGR